MRGRLSHRLGEEAREIGRVVEAQIIGGLGDRHGGIEQRPLRFQQDALLDQLIWKHAGDHQAGFAQPRLGDAQGGRILGQGHVVPVMLLDQFPEAGHQGGGCLGMGGLDRPGMFQRPGALHQDAEKMGIRRRRMGDVRTGQFMRQPGQGPGQLFGNQRDDHRRREKHGEIPLPHDHVLQIGGGDGQGHPAGIGLELEIMGFARPERSRRRAQRIA